jgi:hypothetical protein
VRVKCARGERSLLRCHAYVHPQNPEEKLMRVRYELLRDYEECQMVRGVPGGPPHANIAINAPMMSMIGQ